MSNHMMLRMNIHRKKVPCRELNLNSFTHWITLLQENQNKIHKICEASSFEACNVELLIKKETNLIDHGQIVCVAAF